MEYKGYEFDFDVYYPYRFHGMQYKAIIDLIEEVKPERICELGSGQSTRIFMHYCDKYGKSAVSIEHNEDYKQENSVLLPLVEQTTFEVNGGKTYDNVNKYDGLEDWLQNQEKFDFVLIDGPFERGPIPPENTLQRETTYEYARVQVLDFVIFDKLADNSTVLFHDSELASSKATLADFENLLTERGYTFTKSVDIPENKTWINCYRQMTTYRITKQS